MTKTSLNYVHVDVFATDYLTGNGLAVFIDTEELSQDLMQQLTQEMRQYESIFLSGITEHGAKARIFTVEEELPFAGHPILGAAAVLHRRLYPEEELKTWELAVPVGNISVTTCRRGAAYLAEMNQGEATTGPLLPASALAPFLERLGLEPTDMPGALQAQVISTGLPYLIVPVRSEALPRVAVRGGDLEPLLATIGAKFLLVLDTAACELRTWDNLGRVEDIATGSAAGPVADYLFSHGLADPDAPLVLAQGRFAGRPSKIHVRRDAGRNLFVSGEVWPFASGSLGFDLP